MRKPRQTTAKPRRNQKPSDQEGASRLGSSYDKIFKENLDKSLKTIIQDISGLKIVKSEPLPTRMQHTKERDPDELSLIWLPDGTQRILHAEVHLKDEYDINFRMCEYHVLLKRKKKVPNVVQYVIYIGIEDPKHITGIWETESLVFHYNVIVLKNIPYKTFLDANTPEAVILSILGDFQDADPEIVSTRIVERIDKLSKTHGEKEKFYAQLRVISKLRKLQPLIEKIMTNISKFIDVADDPLYLEGKLEGKLEGYLEKEIENVKSLIINTEFDDAHIAFLMGVHLELVQKLRKEYLEGFYLKNGQR